MRVAATRPIARQNPKPTGDRNINQTPAHRRAFRATAPCVRLDLAPQPAPPAPPKSGLGEKSGLILEIHIPTPLEG